VEEQGMRAPAWVTLARAALALGLTLFAAAVLITAVLPQGAAFTRLYLLQAHAGVRLAMIAVWPAAAALLLALVAAVAVRPPASPSQARLGLLAAAAALVAGGVCALRGLGHADQALYRLAVPGLEKLGNTFLTEAASWLAWMAALAWAGFCVAVLLVAAAALARRRPAVTTTGSSAAVDAAARRLAVLAGIAAAVVVCVQFAYTRPWTSAFAALAGRSGFGGRLWPVATLLVLGQLAWVLPAVVVAAVGRGPKLSWLTWAAAGICGAALSVKGLLHVLPEWTPRRIVELLFQLRLQDAPGGLTHVIEVRREHLLTAGVMQGALLVLALGLISAAYRQFGATAPGAAAVRRPSQDRATGVVVVAIAVALAAPLISAVAVGDGGSLLGFAPVAGLQSEPQRAPEATKPSPIASPSPAASGGPVVTGVIPGLDQTPQGPSSGNAMWNGDVVQVNYEPNGAKVDPARCRLSIDGDPVAVPATSLAMSRKTETLNWSLRRPLRRGRHEFTVVLVTRAGAEYSWGWSYSF
jgi:hypothetical protein